MATGNRQHNAAQAVYDEVVGFGTVLHYNDGDRHDSQESAEWLRRARTKLDEQIAHLDSVPFQPDR